MNAEQKRVKVTKLGRKLCEDKVEKADLAESTDLFWAQYEVEGVFGDSECETKVTVYLHQDRETGKIIKLQSAADIHPFVGRQSKLFQFAHAEGDALIPAFTDLKKKAATSQSGE